VPSVAYAQDHPEVGSQLIREWAPDGEARANIVLVHGIAEHSGRHERTGRLLAGAGFHVRGFDLIGAGGTGGRRWDIDDWGRYHDQVGEHVQWARFQGKPVVLLGHSLGGAIALGYTLSDRMRPDLLVLSAPAMAGGTGWQRTLARLLARIVPTLALSNAVKGDHLSRDPAVAEAYFADPLVVTRATVRFGALAFAQIDELNDRVEELEVPTLVVHGGDDRLVPTSSTECFESMPNVERWVLPRLRHEVFNEPEGPDVIADVARWVGSRI
jgi:alpha-beta hydrolase superfamily lysophospholipase